MMSACSVPASSSATSNIFASPGMMEVAAILAGRDELRVLDLGSSRAANIEFYKQFSCRLRIEDLRSTIVERAVNGIKPSEGDALEGVLEGIESDQFDLILMWDLINYLAAPRVIELAERLAYVAKPSAVVFLQVWSAPSMPAIPNSYLIKDRGQLQHEHYDVKLVAAPRYTKKDLMRLIPDFRRSRSFLISSGVEEYVLRYGSAD